MSGSSARVKPAGEVETHLVDNDDDVLHGDGCENGEKDPFLEAWADEEVPVVSFPRFTGSHACLACATTAVAKNSGRGAAKKHRSDNSRGFHRRLRRWSPPHHRAARFHVL